MITNGRRRFLHKKFKWRNNQKGKDTYLQCCHPNRRRPLVRLVCVQTLEVRHRLRCQSRFHPSPLLLDIRRSPHQCCHSWMWSVEEIAFESTQFGWISNFRKRDRCWKPRALGSLLPTAQKTIHSIECLTQSAVNYRAHSVEQKKKLHFFALHFT